MPSLSDTLKKFSAVIITGGSSGIGKSFIEQCAKLNPEMLICNLSRRHPDINIPQLKLRHFTCDLAEAGEIERVWPDLAARLIREAAPGRILLINNSGFGAYGRFPEPDLVHHLGMIDVNVRAVVHLTGRLLPLLKTRGGVILTVASTAAFQPTPWMATYGATKAFVLHWSLALNEELRGKGVLALAVCPGPTESEFHVRAGMKKSSDRMRQSSEEVVLAALKAMAAGRGQVVTGWLNRLGVIAASLAPKPLITRVSGQVLAKFRMPKAVK